LGSQLALGVVCPVMTNGVLRLNSDCWQRHCRALQQTASADLSKHPHDRSTVYLDCVGEWHSHLAKADIGQDVADNMNDGQGVDRLEL